MNPLTPILCIAMGCCFVVVMTLLIIVGRVVRHFTDKDNDYHGRP